MPEQHTTVVAEWLNFFTTFIPYSAVVAIFWKIIDSILKYASDGRDSRTIELIRAENKPLAENIKELTKSIWELSKQVNGK